MLSHRYSRLPQLIGQAAQSPRSTKLASFPIQGRMQRFSLRNPQTLLSQAHFLPILALADNQRRRCTLTRMWWRALSSRIWGLHFKLRTMEVIRESGMTKCSCRRHSFTSFRPRKEVLAAKNRKLTQILKLTIIKLLSGRSTTRILPGLSIHLIKSKSMLLRAMCLSWWMNFKTFRLRTFRARLETGWPRNNKNTIILIPRTMWWTIQRRFTPLKSALAPS